MQKRIVGGGVMRRTAVFKIIINLDRKLRNGSVFFCSMRALTSNNRKMKEKSEETNSPAQKTLQIVSDDDDEIDYSVKPEFYDPKIDERNEKWVKKQRRGFSSDAVLSCPACFTTLSFDCQRHDKYLTQYRAIFVENCRIKEEVATAGSKRKRNKKGFSESEKGAVATETYKSVCCSVCSTDVGVIDEDEVYHFFNVLPSEA